MRASSSHWTAVGIGLILSLSTPLGRAEEPKAYIDGTRPGWRALSEPDFINVNCGPETWSWESDLVRCTGQPVGT